MPGTTPTSSSGSPGPRSLPTSTAGWRLARRPRAPTPPPQRPGGRRGARAHPPRAEAAAAAEAAEAAHEAAEAARRRAAVALDTLYAQLATCATARSSSSASSASANRPPRNEPHGARASRGGRSCGAAVAVSTVPRTAVRLPPASSSTGRGEGLCRGRLPSYGWGSDQFDCLDLLWTRESGWRADAYNASSGAYGIPQSLPGSKMASAGADWRTNAATQINWGLGYIDAPLRHALWWAHSGRTPRPTTGTDGRPTNANCSAATARKACCCSAAVLRCCCSSPIPGSHAVSPGTATSEMRPFDRLLAPSTTSTRRLRGRRDLADAAVRAVNAATCPCGLAPATVDPRTAPSTPTPSAGWPRRSLRSRSTCGSVSGDRSTSSTADAIVRGYGRDRLRLQAAPRGLARDRGAEFERWWADRSGPLTRRRTRRDPSPARSSREADLPFGARSCSPRYDS